MVLEPCRGLADGIFVVEILDVKTVSNDSNANVPVRKTPERCGGRTWHGTELFKQVSLRHGEPDGCQYCCWDVMPHSRRPYVGSVVSESWGTPNHSATMVRNPL